MILRVPREMVSVALLVALISAETLLLVALISHRNRAFREARAALKTNAELVSRMGLTDLALWSEARYVRHPSQADLFSPFGDHPSSLEHFPAGSFAPPAGTFSPAATDWLSIGVDQ